MLILTAKQNQFKAEYEIPEEINGVERALSGDFTFMPNPKGGRGSFSLKIKSGDLSRDKSERAAVLDAWNKAGAEMYDRLVDMIEQHNDDVLGAGGQLHLQKELDSANSASEPAEAEAMQAGL